LHVIGVDRPAAVTGALLLAESWRMDGEPDKAVQWFLRIAAQQPQNLDTLNGLLAAAHTLADSGQPQLALTLYRRVEQEAGAAATLRTPSVISIQPRSSSCRKNFWKVS